MFNAHRSLGSRARFVHALCAALAMVILALPASSLATPRDHNPPTAPTNLHTTAVGAYAISISWNASTDNSGRFTYFLVLVDGYAGVAATVPQTQRAYTWGGPGASYALRPGRTYTLYLWAIDAAGNRSANSNQITVTLPADTTAPTTPVLTLQSAGSDYISLSWTGAADDGPDANVTFSVFRDGTLVAHDLASRGFTQTGLDEGAKHTYTIQARDAFGNVSPVSSELTVTTPIGDPGDVTPPTTPTNVYAEVFGDGEFWLTWTQSTDDFSPQARITYNVYVDGVFSDTQLGRAGPSIDYTNGSESTVTLIAVDEVGNESAPAIIFVRVP